MRNYKNNSVWFIAGVTLWVLAAIGVGYGIYLTFFYDGVISNLIPFTAISLLGTLLSIAGAKKLQPLLVVLGLILMTLAPTGFFWLCNICAILGAAVCTVGFRTAKTSTPQDS